VLCIIIEAAPDCTDKRKQNRNTKGKKARTKQRKQSKAIHVQLTKSKGDKSACSRLLSISSPNPLGPESRQFPSKPLGLQENCCVPLVERPTLARATQRLCHHRSWAESRDTRERWVGKTSCKRKRKEKKDENENEAEPSLDHYPSPAMLKRRK
jgi:hypothetical protein